MEGNFFEKNTINVDDINLKNRDDFETVELNRNTPIPLYFQIAQIIRKQIKSGELKPGDQILTEEKLQKKFNVSRATVRKAISDLVYDGLLEKHYSKGTIVAPPKFEEAMYGVCSFTSSTLKTNQTLKTKILEFEEISNDTEIANKLGLEENEPIRYMKRVRYIDGEPICVEEWYAPSKYLPNFRKELFEEEGMGQSSYYVIQNYYNIKIKSVQDTMSAVAVANEDAKLLNTYNGMPALLRQRITFDENKVPIVYSSGRYLIKITLGFLSNTDY